MKSLQTLSDTAVSVPPASSPRRRRLSGFAAGRRLALIEGVSLAVAIVLPFALAERLDLITLATNVLILSLLAISFDLCWGLSGIMSFGQALFFGVAGYVIALVGRDLEFSMLWGTLPLAMLVGLLLSGLFAAFLLLGRKPPTTIFVALGTLTGSYAAERLVSGWQYVGAGNGLSSVKLLQLGSYEFVEGTAFYFLALIVAGADLCRRALPQAVSQLGLVLAGMRQNEERLAFFGYRVQLFKALVFSLAGMVAGPGRRALQLPPGLHRTGQHGAGPVDDGGDLQPVRRLGHPDRSGIRAR